MIELQCPRILASRLAAPHRLLSDVNLYSDWNTSAGRYCLGCAGTG